MRPSILSALLALALFWAPTVSRAADPAALAETLFRRGKAGMEEGRYDEACADLRESLRLDRAGGTQLTLALCYERAGKYASAWLAYLEALSFAQRDGRADREKIAREQAARMDRLAPRIVVRVPAEVAELRELTITMDAEPLERSGWATGIPADPGKHEIRAAAADRKPWTTDLVLTGKGAEIVVPILEPLPASEGAASIPVAPSPALPPAPLVQPPVLSCPKCKEPPPPRPATQRILAGAAGGTAVALLAVGALFGISAAMSASEVCDRKTCPASEQGDYDYYRMSARTANVTFGLGLAFSAVSAVLFLTDGSPTPPED